MDECGKFVSVPPVNAARGGKNKSCSRLLLNSLAVQGLKTLLLVPSCKLRGTVLSWFRRLPAPSQDPLQPSAIMALSPSQAEQRPDCHCLKQVRYILEAKFLQQESLLAAIVPPEKSQQGCMMGAITGPPLLGSEFSCDPAGHCKAMCS